MSGNVSAAAPEAVLNFWFGITPAEQATAARRWFEKDDAFDTLIRERFSATHAALRQDDGRLARAWAGTARGSLAAIVVLDQFSRNMFRGSARMFEADALALQLAQAAVAKGQDTQLPAVQRRFIYMPFEHAESAAMQQQSLQLFAALAQELGEADVLLWAQKHADIVARFGRYPHRNALLGRASTAEELDFLKQPGSAF